MSNVRNGLVDNKKVKQNKDLFLSNFSSVIVDGLLDDTVELCSNNNNNNTTSENSTSAQNCESTSASSTSQVAAGAVEGLPRKRRGREYEQDNRSDDELDSFSFADGEGNGNENDADAEASSSSTTCTSTGETSINFVSRFSSGTGTGNNGTLIKLQQQKQQHNQQSYLQIQSTSSSPSILSLSSYSSASSPRSGHSSWESADQQGTSLESESSCCTVSFLTEIEVKPGRRGLTKVTENSAGGCDVNKVQNDEARLLLTLKMDTSEVESADKGENEPTTEEDKGTEETSGKDDGGDQEAKPTEGKDEQGEMVEGGEDEEEDEGCGAEGEDCGDGFDGEDDDEDDDTTTLSSEAVVDDIELILMPEMCHDMSSANLSPKLVRVTELKLNADDVFCDDETDEDQSSRHEFRSIVDEVCEEEEGGAGGGGGQHDRAIGRFSTGDDDLSSGSELISGRRVGAAGGSSKSSSSSGGRRRRSSSGRINSGVQTDITAVEEPTPLSSGHGFRKKTSGKSSRLGIPGGSGNGKKLNWKSELTLLPSKMKVKQSGFNSFESNDERDQYSPRVAKFTSQDTLNLTSQFLKPSTLYRTRNLSRNLNQFASSESTFMLPMSSEQQLSSCGVGESPRFRDRVSSSTSAAGVGGVGGAGNFKGAATSYSAYQISSMLSGSGAGVGMGTPLSSARLSRQPHQPLISGYSGGGAGHMMMMSSRHFRSSMPDLNAVNKSYAAVAAATMADSHRRRQPSSSKSIKHSSSSSRHRHPHHHSSTSSAGGFRLQKRSSSDEETSSLIDESERCLRSSIDLLLTDELPSPGGGIIGAGDSSCFRSSGFGGSTAANVGGPGGFYYHSSRRSCSQPILNDQAYPPEMKDPSMGSPFLPRKLSDMRCSRWAKVILPNGHVAVVSVKETDEIQDSLTVHTDTGCVINLPFRKVVFAWRSSKR